MVRIKGKKFLAIAIAGAVFVGGVFPETACAAETAESTSDVQVEETKQQSVKSIQENLLEAYNTGFESSDSNGLYWWSDGNWGKENIAQKAYEGDQKPAEDSGGYYVEVTPDGEGIGTAQICAEISHLFWNQRYPMSSLSMQKQTPKRRRERWSCRLQVQVRIGLLHRQQR